MDNEKGERGEPAFDPSEWEAAQMFRYFRVTYLGGGGADLSTMDARLYSALEMLVSAYHVRPLL